MPKTNRKRRFMAERLERNMRGWRASKHGEAVHAPSGKEGRAFDCRFMVTCCRVTPAFFTSPCGPPGTAYRLGIRAVPLLAGGVREMPCRSPAAPPEFGRRPRRKRPKRKKEGGPFTMNFVVPKPPARRAIISAGTVSSS